MRALKTPLLLAGLGAVLATSLPVAAQKFSPGYDFLKAVRDSEGDAVTDKLNEPGNTLINSRDIGTGESALHIVTQRRDVVWIRFLAARGANPNIEDNKGNTPLQIASNLGFVEGVEALLKAGARVDVTNSAGETPLISAVHRRDIALVRMLLTNGADPDRNDNSGRSARDYASLMSGGTVMIEAMDEAAAKRAGKGESYGPALK
jgi:uncharacterized protein